MNQDDALRPLSPEELAAETGAALPDKEVISLLDLNADLDIALDAAAPIDLAVAANANVAAPIDAAASANILSALSSAARELFSVPSFPAPRMTYDASSDAAAALGLTLPVPKLKNGSEYRM